MVCKVRINEAGEEVKMPVCGTVAPVPRATPRRRETGVDDVTLARAVIESFNKPVVFQAGLFWGFTEGLGWQDMTSELVKACHNAKRKNANDSLVKLIGDFISVPSPTSHPENPVYWERVGGLWLGHWEPFALSEHEVLLTDGIFDVLTGELTPITGRIVYGPRISLPWSTEDGEIPTCPEFEAMISFAFPDPETRKHFQETVSLVLQPHSLLRGQIVFWGPPGTCKTTIATAIGCAPAGSLGCSFIQEAELVKSRWTAAGLINKFANVSDDSPLVSGWPGWIKRYSSGSLLVESKYHQPTNGAATAKMFSTCNEFQNVADASGAMIDRLFPFQFENRVTGVWDSRRMTPRYWSSTARRAGVLSWLLEGLTRLLSRGHLSPPSCWLEQKQTAVSSGDPLEGWLRENLIASPLESIEREALVGKIPAEVLPKQWGNGTLITYLERLFKVKTARKTNEAGNKTRIYEGIAFLD